MTDQAQPAWPYGTGEMAGRIRAFDWSRTALGAAGTWTERRRNVVDMVLAIGFPAVVLVGRDLVQIYNDGFRRLIGEKQPAGLGQPTRDCWPQVWHIDAPIHARVRAGETVTFQDALHPIRRDGALQDAWFTLSYSPLRDQDGTVADILLTMFETTARVATERKLRLQEERQAFLLRLSDALRPLGDPGEIQATAARELGRRLGANRVVYAESQGEHFVVTRNYVDGAAEIVGRQRYADFGGDILSELQVGRNRVQPDARNDSRLSDRQKRRLAAADVGASLNVPLVKGGRLVAFLGVNHPAAHDFRPSEIALVEEVAERTWAASERARAEASLRESEDRLRGFGEASTDVLWIRDAETLVWTYLTPAFEVIYGLPLKEALGSDDFRTWTDLILPEDRDRALAAIDRVRDGERITFEYRIRRPSDGAVRWLRNTDFPIRDANGRVTAIGGVGHDITQVKEAERLIRASRRRLRTLVEGVPQLVWRGVDCGEWTWSSPQWTAYTGLSEAASTGRGWLAALHPEDHERAMDAWRKAEASGDPLEVEYRIRRAGGETYRWFQTRALPVRDEDTGEIIEWLGTSNDIDDLRQMQEEQTIMVAELQHRTRNLIGVVGSVARQTMAHTGPTGAFQREFMDRLEALSRVQGLLSRAGEEHITIREVVEMELEALGALSFGERVTVAGPDVPLRKSIVQTMALAIHELATNARKYGALAGDEGELTVRWSTSRTDGEERRLCFEWRERGVEVRLEEGHAVTQGGGYGRQLIEKSLPYSLKAQTTYELGPDGLRCTIDLPMTKPRQRIPPR